MIKYSKVKHKKYKYRLDEEHIEEINGFQNFKNEYIELSYDQVKIKEGYMWDGATCAINTKNFMTGSLVHDVMYQCIRESNWTKIEKRAFKKFADLLLKKIVISYGMSKVRANVIYAGVLAFGGVFGKLKI